MKKKLKIGIVVLILLVLFMLIFQDQIETFWYDITTPIGPGGIVPQPIENIK